jgi:hypothetical protein
VVVADGGLGSRRISGHCEYCAEDIALCAAVNGVTVRKYEPASSGSKKFLHVTQVSS